MSCPKAPSWYHDSKLGVECGDSGECPNTIFLYDSPSGKGCKQYESQDRPSGTGITDLKQKCMFKKLSGKLCYSPAKELLGSDYKKYDCEIDDKELEELIPSVGGCISSPGSSGSSNYCKNINQKCSCCDDWEHSGDNIACGQSKGDRSCNVSCEKHVGDVPKCKSGSNNIKQRKRKVGGNGGNGPGSSPQPSPSSPSASSQDWFAKHKALVLGLSIGIPVALIVLFLLYSFA